MVSIWTPSDLRNRSRAIASGTTEARIVSIESPADKLDLAVVSNDVLRKFLLEMYVKMVLAIVSNLPAALSMSESRVPTDALYESVWVSKLSRRASVACRLHDDKNGKQDLVLPDLLSPPTSDAKASSVRAVAWLETPHPPFPTSVLSGATACLPLQS